MIITLTGADFSANNINDSVKRYKVTFSCKDADGGALSPTSSTRYYSAGSNVTFTASNVPTISGYTFQSAVPASITGISADTSVVVTYAKDSSGGGDEPSPTSISVKEFKGLYFDSGLTFTEDATSRMVAFNVDKNTDFEIHTQGWFNRFRIGFSNTKADLSVAPVAGGKIDKLINTKPGRIKLNSENAQTIYIQIALNDDTTPVNDETFKVVTPATNEVEYLDLIGYYAQTTGATDNTIKGTKDGTQSIGFNVKPNTTYTFTDNGTHNRFRIYGSSEYIDYKPSPGPTPSSFSISNVILEGQDTATTYTFDSGDNTSVFVYLNSGDKTKYGKVTITEG